jgi:acetyl-CoA acetyltransferase
VAVAWLSRKRGSPQSRPWARADRMESVAPDAVPRAADWYRPWGMLRPVDQIAALARRYMYEYGATRDHLANVALAARSHANRNPNAMMYERVMTRDDYFNSRWISEPSVFSTTVSKLTVRSRWSSSRPSAPGTAGMLRRTSTPSPRASTPSIKA